MADVTIADLSNAGNAARTDQIETDDGANSRRRTLAQVAGLTTTSDIADFASATRAQTEAELVAGTNVTITPGGSGAMRTLTISAAGGGSSNVAVTAATNVIAAAHAGNKLFLTGSGALTVNGSTGFADYAQCEVYNWTGGNSPVAASGVAIDVPTGLTAVLSQGGAAVLTRKASGGNYHLTGDLVAA